MSEVSTAQIAVEHTPLDKSWYIRQGVLDLLGDRDDTVTFLDRQLTLADDLVALRAASADWPKPNTPVRVDESGTLYRDLLFASWKFGLGKEFICSGTLRNRRITSDPSIVNLSQRELLTLDNQTSQWASAAALAGDPERLEDAPPKLKLTYQAIDHWQARRPGDRQAPVYDQTIARQAATFRDILADRPISYAPADKPEEYSSEDFCFAVAMGFITLEEGLALWPSLVGHETNRPEELPAMINKAESGQAVDSRDHRVVQAVAMCAKLMDREVEIVYPDAVNKSWPEFWQLMAEI